MNPSGQDERLEAAVVQARYWAAHDPDPATRIRVEHLVAERSPELVALFEGRLGFGTAGLRGRVGPGPMRMNALGVRQSTAAVMRVLAEAGIDSPRVVVGFDARRDSQRFAAHAGATVTAEGGTALLADRAVPTPVVAHSVLAEEADAAIVITASHNPAGDNGLKLFLGDGRQIIAPWDELIATKTVELATDWSRVGPGIDSAFGAGDAGDWVDCDAQSWIERHGQAAVAAAHGFLDTDAHKSSSLSVVYTPMHGVGGPAMMGAFEMAGLAPPIPVATQFDPDPDFCTVAFPNPEEPGALDEAFAQAARVGASTVFAHDPDADRLAVAVPNRAGTGLVALSGDELGVLLGDFVINKTEGNRAVARSVVSSRLLDDIAQAGGVRCHVTLTGFKWISRTMDADSEATWLFGYEEAIGYSVGTHVRDKDGITAALVAYAMLVELRARARTVWDRLDELAAVHGVYVSQTVVKRFDQQLSTQSASALTTSEELIAGLASSPPAAFADSSVVAVTPIGAGALPATPGVELLCQDRTRVIVRPSGTEPKVKAYIEVCESVSHSEPADREQVHAARARAQDRLNRVRAQVAEILEPGSTAATTKSQVWA